MVSGLKHFDTMQRDKLLRNLKYFAQQGSSFLNERQAVQFRDAQNDDDYFNSQLWICRGNNFNLYS